MDLTDGGKDWKLKKKNQESVEHLKHMFVKSGITVTATSLKIERFIWPVIW
jgi:hypothetical protein